MNANNETTIETGANGLVLSETEATISEERRTVALQALYELNALTQHGPKMATDDVSAADLRHLFRLICSRANELALVACSALDDELDPVDSLAERLN
jgi:hypothetical protein